MGWDSSGNTRLNLTDRIILCHRCKKRDGAACRSDRAPLELHARLDYCPAKKYGDGKPEGWEDAARFVKVPEQVPADYDPSNQEHREAGKCGC